MSDLGELLAWRWSENGGIFLCGRNFGIGGQTKSPAFTEDHETNLLVTITGVCFQETPILI